ncbi:MAG: hypothetical protein R3E96_09655 [Planctomycetota bacterium]
MGTSQVEVLPSGIAPGPESQDWYEHARWPELLEEAGRDFDVVLVQLPELPAEAEWEGLAARLGSVLPCAAPSRCAPV